MSQEEEENISNSIEEIPREEEEGEEIEGEEAEEGKEKIKEEIVNPKEESPISESTPDQPNDEKEGEVLVEVQLEQDEHDSEESEEEESLKMDDRSIDGIDLIEENIIKKKNYKNFHAQSEEFIHFQRTNPSIKIGIRTNNKLKDVKTWQFYRKGPQKDPQKRILFMPSLLETMDTYYQQISILHAKGYEIIACNPPACDSIEEWIVQFKNFLSKLGIPAAHMYGTGLGGYLLQCFAETYPRYVNSLILCNSFESTSYWASKIVFPDLAAFLPKSLLRLIIESIFPNYAALDDKRAYEFMIEQLNSLNRKNIYSRLLLNILQTDKLVNDHYPIPDKHITIINAIDQSIIPLQLQQRLKKKYPEAKIADLRTGADFPHLTNAEDINMHIEVHVRNVIQYFKESIKPAIIHEPMKDENTIQLTAVPEKPTTTTTIPPTDHDDNEVKEDTSSPKKEQKGFFDDDDDDDTKKKDELGTAQFDELMKQHM